MDENTFEKAVTAAELYLQMREYDIIDKPAAGPVAIVAYDNTRKTLAFIAVAVSESATKFPAELSNDERGNFEAAAIQWFMTSGRSITERFRFDQVAVMLIDKNEHALLKHHINALGGAENV